MKTRYRLALLLVSTIPAVFMSSGKLPADTGSCGGVTISLPFTDVGGSAFFCQIAEAFFSGLTNGTTPTNYSPSNNVPREQMAAFIIRTQDSALRRGSRRAILGQWSTPLNVPTTGRTTIGAFPALVASDGADLWVAELSANDVKRVRASDGRLLETWTGATSAFGILVARGRIYVTGATSPGHLYEFDPGSSSLSVTTHSSALGAGSRGVTTDGTWIWVANITGGSVSRLDFDPAIAPSNITTGFSHPNGILFDGTNVWVTDSGDNTLKKIRSPNGDVLQSVPVGLNPQFPAFDGSNIWVPNADDKSVSVVRARDGLVLATLMGNGLSSPSQAAFDGQRVLVTNLTGNSVSVWKATDLTPISTYSAGNNTSPLGACADGVNFWITMVGTSQLARF
jgi:DNA-binding beta-propeller fold protein YncE